MLYVETISIIMYTLAPAFRIECAGAGLIVYTQNCYKCYILVLRYIVVYIWKNINANSEVINERSVDRVTSIDAN